MPRTDMQVSLKDVAVPARNILLGEGRGFEIAQGRLGPGGSSLHAVGGRRGTGARTYVPPADVARIRQADFRTVDLARAHRAGAMHDHCARLLTLKAAYMWTRSGTR